MRKLTLSAAVLMAMVFSAQPLIAQQLSLSILNSGKTPDAPVPVKVVEDGQETLVATADRNGDAEVDISVISAGTDVCVKIVDGEVHLIPKGDGDCDDDAVGVIPWGETRHINVDTGTGAFSTGLGYAATNPIKIGLGIDYFSLTNLEDTGCLNASNCNVDDTGIGGRLFFEYGITDNIHLGLGATYRSFQVGQDFGGGDVSRVDVDVIGLTGYAGFSTRLSDRASFFGNGGLSWLNNSGDITSLIGGQTFRDSRSESGIRFRAGSGVDFGISDRAGIRLGFNYTIGDEDDADTGFDVGAALMLGF